MQRVLKQIKFKLYNSIIIYFMNAHNKKTITDLRDSPVDFFTSIILLSVRVLFLTE